MNEYKDVAKKYLDTFKKMYGDSWRVSEQYLFVDVPQRNNLDLKKWAIEMPIVLRAHGLKIKKTKNPKILEIERVST